MPHSLKHLALFSLSVFAFRCSESDQGTSADSDSSQDDAIRSEWSHFEKRDRNHHSEFLRPLFDAIWAGDFQTLEHAAEKYRSEKTILHDGSWALNRMYSLFDSYSYWNKLNADEYFPKLEKRMLEWREAFPDIYYRLTFHQLPRWHGNSHTEWHPWLVAALSEAELTDTQRDEIHAQTLLEMSNYYDFQDREPNMFDVAGADWERLHRGAEMLMEKYPTATRLPSRHLRLAMNAEDFDVARSIVKRMDHVFDSREWVMKDDPDFFAIIEFLEEEEEATQAEAGQKIP